MTEQTTTIAPNGRVRSGSYEPPSGPSSVDLNRFGRAIDAVKAGVRIEEVAAEHAEMKLAGPNRLLGRCPHPNHTDRTPSFTVFTDTQRFKCFGIGCGISGDVVHLEQICGRHDTLWTAMVALAVRYGVELPVRSKKWRRWQGEKRQIEDLTEDIRSQVRSRRIFKYMILNAPEIRRIEDPNERREEIRLCWEAFQDGMRKVRR